MIRYLIQFGNDGACEYWNANMQTSRNIEDIKDGGFTSLERAKSIRNLWDSYAKHKCVFKIVEVETES